MRVYDKANERIKQTRKRNKKNQSPEKEKGETWPRKRVKQKMP